MTMLILVNVLIFLIIVGYIVLSHCRYIYKIAYYEQKLKNRGVDISSVENMSLLDPWK